MNGKNTKTLWEKYPIMFSGRFLSIQQSLIPFGFECDDGWYKIIDELCETICSLIEGTDIKVTADQVKEKFGGLRFYYHTECPPTFTYKIIFKIKSLMFTVKLGKYYWEIKKFRKKFYSTIEEKISNAVDHTEGLSYKTCERCGKPGKITGKGWVVTLCEKCNHVSKK